MGDVLIVVRLFHQGINSAMPIVEMIMKKDLTSKKDNDILLTVTFALPLQQVRPQYIGVIF